MQRHPKEHTKTYQKLSAEFHDISKPSAGAKELAFYAQLLRPVSGPILEAMCGSGRLLVPLRRIGLDIDGVDSSWHMLQRCRKRGKEHQLHVRLYHQFLQRLSLRKKYAMIFISIGSFQLIHDKKDAIDALKNLHKHLSKEGMLALEIFPPCKEPNQPADSKIVTLQWTARSPEGIEIVNRSRVTIDYAQQLQVSQTHYEKIINGQVISSEEEENVVRWYFSTEIENLLNEAGFILVKKYEESFEINPQASIYLAQKILD